MRMSQLDRCWVLVNTCGSDINILKMANGIDISLATILYNFFFPQPGFSPAINYPIEGCVLKHKTLAVP